MGDGFRSAWCHLCACLSILKLSEKEEILLDVTSRLWFTYRKNFPAIGKSECILEVMLAHS